MSAVPSHPPGPCLACRSRARRWVPLWCRRSAPASLARAGVPADPNLVLQSMLQNVIVISDLLGPTGGITLQSTTGASIIVNDTGVYIKNGKGASIQMVGTTVTINSGALVVT